MNIKDKKVIALDAFILIFVLVVVSYMATYLLYKFYAVNIFMLPIIELVALLVFRKSIVPAFYKWQYDFHYTKPMYSDDEFDGF